MGTMSVVVPSPLFDQDRGFFQGVEDLRVQKLISELAIETLAIAVLPRAAGLNEQRADIQPFEPVSDSMSAELWSVVRSDVVGWTMGDEQLGEERQHVIAVQPSGHQDRQTFATEFVDHDQHPEGPTVMCTLLDEVVSPDVMTPTWPKTNAGTIVQPETTSFGLLGWHPQSFLPPDTATRLAFTCQP